MPDVIEVRYVRGYTVWIKFDDGTHGDVDISRSFKGPVFEPLRDREYFKQVSVQTTRDSAESRVIPSNRLRFPVAPPSRVRGRGRH